MRQMKFYTFLAGSSNFMFHLEGNRCDGSSFASSHEAQQFIRVMFLREKNLMLFVQLLRTFS